MKKNYSAPAITTRPGSAGRKPAGQGTQQEKKRVDYTHLDIIAEVERITGCSLNRHTRTGKYTCQCPFDDCTSKQDAFLVFDRPELEEGQVHYWCNRCGRRGSLIDLVKELKSIDFKAACADLRIDSRTWRAIDADTDQADQSRATAGDRRRREQETARKAEQAELETLDAAYSRARAALKAGMLTREDDTEIIFDQARAYLAERGFTLDQAAALGMAYIPTRQELGSDRADMFGAWRGRILFSLSGPGRARGYAGRSLFLWRSGMSSEAHKQRLEAWNKQKPEQRIARYYKTRQSAYYGYEEACERATLVIVEGEFDAASVRLALADLPDIAVCAMGKNFHARLVPVNVLHVILALDCDQAGLAAIAHQREELEARGVTTEVARPSAGKDWNDCHVLAGLDAIKEAILSAASPAAPGYSAVKVAPAAPDDLLNLESPLCKECGRDSMSMPGEEHYGYCYLCWVKPRSGAPALEFTGLELFAYRLSQIADVFGGATIRKMPADFTLADRVAELKAEQTEAGNKSEVYWKELRQRLARQGYYDQVARSNDILAARVAAYRERWL